MAQPDPAVALQMAQQEMDYRVQLFNKWVPNIGMYKSYLLAIRTTLQ
jgi:hypothetical protein